MVMAPSGRHPQGYSPSFRGRGRVGGSFSSRVPTENLPPNRDFMEGLVDTPLQTIAIPARDSNQEEVTIVDPTYVGSYNWTRHDKPTIMVPGSPPLWRNRQMPYTITPDTGIHYVDHNGYRMHANVLLPLVLAVNKRHEMTKAPAFDWASVDFVTDRNNLRGLLRWVNGTSRDFRIDLQLAGEKTILMNRWSARYREVFNGRTYGFSFERESTDPVPGCRGTQSHHRIITYDLNGLKMVVRFEVDACIRPPAKYPRKSVSSMDELADSLGSVSLSQEPDSASGGLLTVLEGGSEVSAASIIEMTTRSQNTLDTRGYDWKEAYPQLYFSQTPHHYLAIHRRGTFTEIQKRKLSEMVQFEKDAQEDLKKLRKALDVIKNIVLEHGKKGRISLVCVEGVLKVYQRSGDDSCLPSTAMRFFESS
ncbi:unnamed protein product [Cyclocybe aegerita]|uniref:Uncharacterized protein n=1 Tax=Cyclocybe aegerita TaxID=1973307 RepID=A0A8S0WQI2_CYCAE|nr:unnamed protein product [Cyclocybe aegerita]